MLSLIAIIVLYIWRGDRRVAQISGRDRRMSHPGAERRPRRVYQQVIRIIIESGLLYTTTASITAISYIAGSRAFVPLTALVCFPLTLVILCH